MPTITFMRHAETTANAVNRWEGHRDSPLTERGRRQAAAAGDRLAGMGFDLVVASNRGRVQETTSILGMPFETDPVWGETDLGEWEGRLFTDIVASDGDYLRSIYRGADLPWGRTGETLGDVMARALHAMDLLAERLGEDGKALVISHGGVILALTGGTLAGSAVPWPVAGVLNTSLTTVRVDGARGLAGYNDAAHLGNGAGELHDGWGDGTTLVLVRHGQSEANLAGRWQGRTDAPLTSLGRDQAGRLATAAPPFDAVYASPLQRARDTGRALADHAGTPVVVHPDLVEMSFGDWEGMRPDEIAARYPEMWNAIYERGDDLPRGETGETFAAAGERMAAVLGQIAADHRGETIAVVSHGGAIRAFGAHLLGLGFANRSRLPLLGNTATARIVVNERRTAIADWNLAAHLDSA
jgi:probable phosphoglycerate mutase